MPDSVSATQDEEVQREREKLRRILGDNKLIFSVDRLDYSKGLLHRLLGFEYFLEKYPKWHGKIVFNMVVIPSRESVGRYQEMKKEIEAAVGRINGKYGSLTWRPLVYQYQIPELPGDGGPVRPQRRGADHADPGRDEPGGQGVPGLPADQSGRADPQRDGRGRRRAERGDSDQSHGQGRNRRRHRQGPGDADGGPAGGARTNADDDCRPTTSSRGRRISSTRWIA